MFYQIRDKGINGGIPTYSQATKVKRILSALMNYARADEMIESMGMEMHLQACWRSLTTLGLSGDANMDNG